MEGAGGFAGNYRISSEGVWVVGRISVSLHVRHGRRADFGWSYWVLMSVGCPRLHCSPGIWTRQDLASPRDISAPDPLRAKVAAAVLRTTTHVSYCIGYVLPVVQRAE